MELNQNNLTLGIEFISAIKRLEETLMSQSSKLDLLTFDETTTFINCSKPWLRKKVFEKSIPYKKLGKNLRFSKDELIQWIDENSVKPV